MYLTADPGVASSILAQSHTLVEIDHEIISTAILLSLADSFKKGCYAPNFEKVEGANCFQLVRPSVRPFVHPLKKLSYSFEIS